jgi:ABC-type amino acid transport substrate-binding protein
MVSDSIHYTKVRAKSVSFCFPTYYYAETLVVKKGNPLKLHSLQDLKDHTCGTVLGTNYAEWLQTIPGVIFQPYKDWQLLSPDLTAGRLDAILFDQPVMAALLKRHRTGKPRSSAITSRAPSRTRTAIAGISFGKATSSSLPGARRYPTAKLVEFVEAKLDIQRRPALQGMRA